MRKTTTSTLSRLDRRRVGRSQVVLVFLLGNLAGSVATAMSRSRLTTGSTYALTA
jgi:hypothetical protein